MEKELIKKMHNNFDDFVRVTADGLEFWLARDLQILLGYDEWRNFFKVLERAKIACKNAGLNIPDHFVDANKMVTLGSGSTRKVDDTALTRHACYLIAQNGDPRKSEIAFAMAYFAIQTRNQELIEKRVAELERLFSREKLSISENNLSGGCL